MPAARRWAPTALSCAQRLTSGHGSWCSTRASSCLGEDILLQRQDGGGGKDGPRRQENPNFVLALGSHPPPRASPPRGPACRFIFPGRLATNLSFICRLPYQRGYRGPGWKLLSPPGAGGPAPVSVDGGGHTPSQGAPKRRGRGSTGRVQAGARTRQERGDVSQPLLTVPSPRADGEHHPEGESGEIRWETPPAPSPGRRGACSFRLNRLEVIVPVIETD